jgi:hypothetical protein
MHRNFLQLGSNLIIEQPLIVKNQNLEECKWKKLLKLRTLTRPLKMEEV